MTYTSLTRDGYRRAVTTLTGLTAVGALTAAGWLSGEAASGHAADLRARAAAQATWEARRQAQLTARALWFQAQAARAAAARPIVRTVWKKRPTRTVIDTVVAAPAGVGPGGQLSASTVSSYSGASAGGSGGSGSSGAAVSHSHSAGGGSAPVAAPPPPPPPPPPHHAPSSGS